MNDRQKPGIDLLRENIITIPNKGGRWHEVIIDTLEIPIPPDGFWVAMEWLDLETLIYLSIFPLLWKVRRYN